MEEVEIGIAVISIGIASVSLFITILFNCFNEYRNIKDREPQLSFSLKTYNDILYLSVQNTGCTKAENIKIKIQSINNNGNQELILDDIFKLDFVLYPREKTQGMVAFYGENMENHVFPYVEIEVIYMKPHIKRKVEYKRAVYYTPTVDNNTLVDINSSLENINKNINQIHKSTLRLANYFDGCEIAPFDELNIISKQHFQPQLTEALKGKEIKGKTREDCIKDRIIRNNTNHSL